VEEIAHLHLLLQGCRRRRGAEAVEKGKMVAGGLVVVDGRAAGGLVRRRWWSRRRRPTWRVMSILHAPGVERWRAPLLRDARDDDQSRR
jgi:hypothetical protein